MKPFVITGAAIMLCASIFIFSSCENGKANNGSDSTASEDTLAKVPAIAYDTLTTNMAYMLAGMPLSDTTGLSRIFNASGMRKHMGIFDEKYSNLNKVRLSPMRDWRDAEMPEVAKEQHTLFYPFSGPDFLNAFTMFPNVDNYIMFGLEPAGSLPDAKRFADTNYVNKYMQDMREALNEIFERNYFITSYMGTDLNARQVKGVLPIVMTFLARTGNKIVKVEKLILKPNGDYYTAALEDTAGKGKLTGLTVEFLAEGKSKTQKIFYFGTDVENNAMAKKENLVKFIQSFKNKVGFIKSASYILHNPNFSVIRDLVLNECSLTLQDDTGIPYRIYKTSGWNVTLYGNYERPIADFPAGYHQQDLKNIYASDSTIEKLNFTFGYHWKTDKTSLMLCTAPKK